MTFDQAVELARDCAQHYSRITVIAVGKFVPAEEAAGSDRWGVSVMVDRKQKTVLWDRADVFPFADVEKPKKAKATAKAKSRRPEPVDHFLF